MWLAKRIALMGTMLALCGAACAPPDPPPGGVVEEGLRPLNGTELYVKRMGAGTPVILVHGGPVLEHGYLLPHLEPLAADHELIFYDQRLSGRSAGTVAPESVTIANFVADIEALRAAVGHERIHLLAHSWGGLLAMRYAIAHPQRLRSLVLLDSMSASSELWQQEQVALAERVSDQDRAARESLMASEAFAAREPAAIRELLLLTFRMQFHDASQISRLQLYLPDDYMARSAQFGALRPELTGYDLHESLRQVDVPALIIYGSAEPGGVFGGAAIVEALPDAEYVAIENAGHFPFVEQPEDVLSALRTFLQRVDTQ